MALAQDLSTCQQVIGATGGSSVEQGLLHAYTVGECVVLTLRKANTDVILTQGFHQPDACLPVSSDEASPLAAWDIQVYPNPSQQWLRIQMSAAETAGLLADVYDMKGQLVKADLRIDPFSGVNIDCQDWQAGTYVIHLRMSEDATATATVRFIKL